MEDYSHLYQPIIGILSIVGGFLIGRWSAPNKSTLDSVFLTKVKTIAANHSLTPEAKGAQILALTEAFNLLST